MTKRKTRKIWAILGAVLLFVVITLSCFGISRKNKVISASANNSEAYDLNDFPTANWFVMSPVDLQVDCKGFSTTNGYDITVNIDGNDPYFFLKNRYTFSLDEGVYVYSYRRFDSATLILHLTTSEGGYQFIEPNIPFEVRGVVTDFHFEVENFVSGNEYVFTELMINKGEVVYPYSPNLNEIYDSGRTRGYSVGKNDGYNLGFSAGQVDSSGSILGSAVKNFVYSLFDAPFQAIEGVLSFDVAGLDFGGIFGTILTLSLIGFVLKVVL